MELTLLSEDTSANEWNEIINAFGDQNFYQCWEWGEFKRQQGWKALRMVCAENGVIKGAAQGFLKTLLGQNAGVLWIPGGPLVLGKGCNLGDVGYLSSVVAKIVDKFGKHGRTVIRCAPYLRFSQPAVELLSELGFSRLRRRSFVYTFLLDLAKPIEKVRAGMKPKWRQKLNRFMRAGIQIERDNSEQTVRDFYSMVRLTEEAKNFRYRIELDQLTTLSRDCSRFKFLLAYHLGKPVGGLTIGSVGRNGIELFAASSPEGYALDVAYGLRWEAIKVFKRVGVELYDLGGVDPNGGRGIYQFKSGFGGELAEFLGEWEHSPSTLFSASLHVLEKFI